MPDEIVVSMRFLTRSEGREVRKGDHVVSPYTFPPWRPLRVTEVYAPTDRTPMFRIHALAALSEWTHATGFCLPPVGATWDRQRDAWIAAGGARLRVRLAEDVDA